MHVVWLDVWIYRALLPFQQHDQKDLCAKSTIVSEKAANSTLHSHYVVVRALPNTERGNQQPLAPLSFPNVFSD